MDSFMRDHKLISSCKLKMMVVRATLLNMSGGKAECGCLWILNLYGVFIMHVDDQLMSRGTMNPAPAPRRPPADTPSDAGSPVQCPSFTVPSPSSPSFMLQAFKDPKRTPKVHIILS